MGQAPGGSAASDSHKGSGDHARSNPIGVFGEGEIELITDGLFTVQPITIKIKSISDIVNIVPFGCVHRNTSMCNTEKWHETLKKMKSLENPYYLGMGDYLDLFSSSERQVFATGNLHETTIDELDKVAKSHVKSLSKELSFMEGRIIGLIGGNHFAVLDHGITSDQYLCQLLNCRYLGCSSYISIIIDYSDCRTAYKIWAHHGKGAARTLGGSIQRVEQMQNAMDADLYAMGHDHHRSIIPADDRLEVVIPRRGEPHLRKRVRWLARTGSFLNSYTPDMKSYIADAAKNPVNQGCVHMRLSFTRYQEEAGRYLKIDAVGGYL